jgi:peptidoglycan/LPS O-acetylase OafA/YrhL
MRYRREIDGLRSVAVLPVILFHAGVSLFSGGFAGVDVFFVISCYLITTIILEERDEGRFSILRFYERRARRILPPLLLVMVACLPFAWAWMTPNEVVAFAGSGRAVIVFLSNVLFWKESGYFAPTADEKPLLHTWSLAVEEQYYLLFPLFLFLCWKLRRPWIAGLLAVLALGSLALAEYASTTMPGADFYLTPMRAWELLAGSLTAFVLFRREPLENTPASLLGLGLVVASVFMFNEDTRWPSLWTLAPVGGTVLIILCATPKTLAGRLLGSKPLVAIGLISYGAYLWHQPLFAFARLRLMETPPLALMLGLAVLSLVLAWASWKFLETPIRRRSFVLSSRALAGTAVLVCTGLLVLGTIGIRQGGFADRFSLPPSVYASLERSDRVKACFGEAFDLTNKDAPWSCRVGLGDTAHQGPARAFIFGDSHVQAFLPAFDRLADDQGLAADVTGTSGCAPFLGIASLRPGDDCRVLTERVYETVKARDIKTLILVARWTYYTDNVYAGGMSYLTPLEGGKRSQEVSRQAFLYGLDFTLKRYQDLGVRVVVVRQVPHQKYAPLDIYLRAYDRPDVAATLDHMSVDRATYQDTQAFVDAAFADAAKRYQNLTLIDLTDSLCNSNGVCPIGTPETAYYYDDNHLSPIGSVRLAGPLWQALRNAGLARAVVGEGG